MKNLKYLFLLLAISASAQIQLIDRTTRVTNTATSLSRVTITNFFTNIVMVVTDTNHVVIGDPLYTAFGKVNDNFSWLSNSVRTATGTNGQTPYRTNTGMGYYWGNVPAGNVGITNAYTTNTTAGADGRVTNIAASLIVGAITNLVPTNASLPSVSGHIGFIPTNAAPAAGTNFYMGGVVQGWTTNTQFSAAGSNVIASIAQGAAASSTAYGMIVANGQTNWMIDFSTNAHWEIFCIPWGTNMFTNQILISATNNEFPEVSVKFRNFTTNDIPIILPAEWAHQFLSESGADAPTNLPVDMLERVNVRRQYPSSAVQYYASFDFIDTTTNGDVLLVNFNGTPHYYTFTNTTGTGLLLAGDPVTSAQYLASKLNADFFGYVDAVYYGHTTNVTVYAYNGFTLSASGFRPWANIVNGTIGSGGEPEFETTALFAKEPVREQDYPLGNPFTGFNKILTAGARIASFSDPVIASAWVTPASIISRWSMGGGSAGQNQTVFGSFDSYLITSGLYFNNNSWSGNTGTIYFYNGLANASGMVWACLPGSYGYGPSPLHPPIGPFLLSTNGEVYSVAATNLVEWQTNESSDPMIYTPIYAENWRQGKMPYNLATNIDLQVKITTDFNLNDADSVEWANFPPTLFSSSFSFAVTTFTNITMNSTNVYYTRIVHPAFIPYYTYPGSYNAAADYFDMVFENVADEEILTIPKGLTFLPP